MTLGVNIGRLGNQHFYRDRVDKLIHNLTIKSLNLNPLPQTHLSLS